MPRNVASDGALSANETIGEENGLVSRLCTAVYDAEMIIKGPAQVTLVVCHKREQIFIHG